MSFRDHGSGNPGTANALRIAGRTTAAVVLVVDIAKGALAFMAGSALASTGGAIGAGIAAIAGQVLNPWFRFSGGKGLGVAAGITLAAWPPGVLITLPFALLGAKYIRAAAGALLGLISYQIGAIVWATSDSSTWWGVPPDDRLCWMAIGVVTLTAPKFVADLFDRQPPDHRGVTESTQPSSR